MTPSLVPTQLAFEAVAAGAVQIVGLAVAAAATATVAAVVYRWYARVRIPEGLAVLAGLAVVAIYLNSDAALSQVIGDVDGSTGLLDIGTATRNVVSFLVAAGGAVMGRRVGDRFALDVGVVSGARELDAELSHLVKSVGRLITVELPETADEIEDIEGYDPVSPETKAALAGKTLVFPRGLIVAELQERLVERLRQDHGVGHVDVDLSADGTVEYLALGSRAAGIGPTLVPGTVATAVRADPPFSAASGDFVQLWTAGKDPERVATAEVRGTTGDLVTLALDEADAEAIDLELCYRLVTLPQVSRPDREFASLLRRAEETMGVVTIVEGSALAGRPIGEVDATVVAVRPTGGSVVTIPKRDRTIEAGDELYVVARPEAIRRLEREGAGAAESP